MQNKKRERIVSIVFFLLFLILIVILFAVNFTYLKEKFNLNFKQFDSYKELFEGLLNTCIITIGGFILGVLFGFITCLVDGINSNKYPVLVLKQIFKVYVGIFRGTPMMVQLLIIYFIVFASIRIDAMYIAILAFGLNSGAYVSEIIRGGINSVPQGQMEAGRSLGLSYFTVMRKIIFPQAIRNCLPSLGNELITLFKDTSIVGFVAAYDLTLAFKKIATRTYDYTFVYLVMGATYFILVFIITKFLGLLERKLLNNANIK